MYEVNYIIILCGIFLLESVFMAGCLFPALTSRTIFEDGQDTIIQVTTPNSQNIAKPSQEYDVINQSLTKPSVNGFGINDKLSYEEEQLLIQNYSPSDLVPESDMARIIFKKSWLVQSDEDPRSGTVRLTFPATWLNTSFVSNNESLVLLRVPKRMLDQDDTNSDPEMITVSYPKRMFMEFSSMNAINRSSAS